MTVAELIQKYNTERQNSLSDQTKMQWLHRCEQMVINDVILTHEPPGEHLRDAENIEYTAIGPMRTGSYGEDGVLHFNFEHPGAALTRVDSYVEDNVLHFNDTTDEPGDGFGMETELLIPEPYDDVYMYYIDQRVAYNNNDIRRYNTASQLFNNAYITYQQWYNRTHRARQPKPHLLRHEVL